MADITPLALPGQTIDNHPNHWEDEARNEWIDLEQYQPFVMRCGMVGASAAIRSIFTAIERLAPYKTTVLIQGESGTGKERVARALHAAGQASGGPFVTFN